MNQVFSFKDIIKKSVLKMGSAGKLTALDISIGLIIAFIVGMFIFYLYRKTYRGVAYSHSFNISIVLMSVITTLIIMTISSNVALSLGMVGALSIVRFRLAIKDPLDIVYLFWAISVGISTGAGLYTLSIVGSLFISMMLLLLMNIKNKENTYVFVVHYSQEAHEEVKLKLMKLKYSVKSKTVRNNNIELTVEVKVFGDNTVFVNEVAEIAGVTDAVLINYSGELAP